LLLTVLLTVPAAHSGPGDLEGSVLERSHGLRPAVLRLGIEAYDAARREGLVRRQILTIIDYSRPAWEPRLWVIDMRAGTVLFEELAAHGMGHPRGTGGTMDRALGFSNEPGSRKSSLGLFITAETYMGRHGYSLRLDGVEPGFNDRARERLIVIHGASYVTRLRAEIHLVGRSWGCPAVRPEVARRLIDAISGGSVVWIYYPDERWLRESRFLAKGFEHRGNPSRPGSEPSPTASPGSPEPHPPEARPGRRYRALR